MDDEQLLQFDKEQALQQLNDDQLERYNELKQQELSQDIEEQKTEDGKNAAKGLKNLRQAAENDLTVKVQGIEFLADVKPQQISKLTEVAEFAEENEDREIDSLKPEELENIRSNILDVLSELSINHSRQDWEENFGDAGIATISTITNDLLADIESFMEQKKSR